APRAGMISRATAWPCGHRASRSAVPADLEKRGRATGRRHPSFRRPQSRGSCMKYKGGCHCGNLWIEFETSLNPAEIELRACQCTFRRKHGSLAVTDPAGRLAIAAAHGKSFERYAFGLRTAEYLICKTCGVYVAAVTIGESEPRGIAIVNCL